MSIKNKIKLIFPNATNITEDMYDYANSLDLYLIIY